MASGSGQHLEAAWRHLHQGTSCPALGCLRQDGQVNSSLEVGEPVRDVEPQEGSSGGVVLQVESRLPLRGLGERVLEDQARVTHQLDSCPSESLVSGVMILGRGSEPVESTWCAITCPPMYAVKSKRCSLVTIAESSRNRIKRGRENLKHPPVVNLQYGVCYYDVQSE